MKIAHKVTNSLSARFWQNSQLTTATNYSFTIFTTYHQRNTQLEENVTDVNNGGKFKINGIVSCKFYNMKACI